VRCPSCKADNDKVVDSRSSRDGAVIRRRRECVSCERRYTTYEAIEEVSLRVIKKDGSRVPFDRGKILAGLLKACEKRPVALDVLEDATSSIERELFERYEREVPSKVVGELVMQRLRDIDQVAYVRFASVYREFKDASQFLDELRPMLERTRPAPEPTERRTGPDGAGRTR